MLFVIIKNVKTMLRVPVISIYQRSHLNHLQGEWLVIAYIHHENFQIISIYQSYILSFLGSGAMEEPLLVSPVISQRHM